MRLSLTLGIIATLLASFAEAPYFHLHNNQASDHVQMHHHGQGTASHSHFAVPADRPHGSPAIRSSEESADLDAIFLVQSSSLTRTFPLLDFLAVETSNFRIDRVEGEFVWTPAHHAHDPPVVVAVSPRAPPA